MIRRRSYPARLLCISVFFFGAGRIPTVSKVKRIKLRIRRKRMTVGKNLFQARVAGALKNIGVPIQIAVQKQMMPTYGDSGVRILPARRGKPVRIVDGIKMRRQRQLLDVADAVNPLCRCFGASQSGQKNGHQNANDGNDDQQLDQSERPTFHRRQTKAIPPSRQPSKNCRRNRIPSPKCRRPSLPKW